MTQAQLTGESTTAKCPFSGAVAMEAQSDQAPTLMRISQVLATQSADSPLVEIVDWVKNFLGKPHPEVGRKGPVCPFVPVSVELDSIWMTMVEGATPSFESISEIITSYSDVFLNTEPKSGPEAINKAIMVVFPNLGEEGAAIVDEVQFKLKRLFVEKGLMLGEFHAFNEGEGLRNPEFRPLRSPIPMLVIRQMVDSDLPFLLRDMYSADDRASFLRSYLSRLRDGNLSTTKFNQALDGVIEAEIQAWVAAAMAGKFNHRAIRSEEQRMPNVERKTKMESQQ